MLLLSVTLAAGFFYYDKSQDKQATTENASDLPLAAEQTDLNSEEVKYLTLTGDEYRTLFLDSSHPNTKVIAEPPVITGDKELDARIVGIAVARGYELQEVPSSELNLYEDLPLQQKMADSWELLRLEAAKAGIQLKIASGMRTVDEQRQLFLERLGSASSDAQIDQVLAMTAPPGYSRHHSGYVVDAEDPSATVFEYSPAYAWLSENNYARPKKFGIIPSYPDGAQKQGPEPEPWEYVWVGQSLLIE